MKKHSEVNPEEQQEVSRQVAAPPCTLVLCGKAERKFTVTS